MEFSRKFNDETATVRWSLLVSVFSSFIPGFVSFCILISAVVLPNWVENVEATQNIIQMKSFGLFYVRRIHVSNLDGAQENVVITYRTREEEATIAISIDPLEQATRALVIIAIIALVPGIIAAIYYGLRRNIRKYSSLIPAGIFLFAAICALCGMSCYSAYLTGRISQAPALDKYTQVEGGLAFTLGWFGTGLAFIATIIAFTSHTIN